MRFATVCSGISAETVAWKSLGWEPMLYAETDKFCSRLLEYYYPDTPNLGDMTDLEKFREYRGAIDLLAAGTPCQSFSIAGKRQGLDDERGNLALVFAQLAHELAVPWIFWENVPGVLSADKGQAFAMFIQTLEKFGYQCAWRTLDLQYFGIPQRRRRVFLVGHLGDWRGPAAVLFESDSLQRASQKSKKPGAEISRALAASTGGASGKELQMTFIAADGRGYSDGRNVGTLSGDHMNRPGDFAPIIGTIAATIGEQAGQELRTHTVLSNTRVRRLTPLECERLMGFPDGYTGILNARNTPRYRALGNSMGVPVVRWIGKRIQDAIQAREEAGK